MQLMPIKILIVEDEAISSMALKYAVEGLGCTVVGAVDTGEAAIHEAVQHRPDLILMDTRLRSDMTGVEAANFIWEQLQIRSAFISAYSPAELKKDYRGAQPFTVLMKPVLEGDLEQLIERLFGLGTVKA
jgi:CheY-like chemotaxis protein